MNLTEATVFASRLFFCVYILPVKDKGMTVVPTSSFIFFI